MDFSAKRDGFCDGFCGGFFVLCFLRNKTDFVTDFGKKKGENNLRVKIHEKIQDQNPRRARGETCCLLFVCNSGPDQSP